MPIIALITNSLIHSTVHKYMIKHLMRDKIDLRASSLFLTLFIVGFLIKYDLLMVRIHQVPLISALVGKNLFFTGLTLLVFYPLVRIQRVRLVLFGFLSIFTIFFITNLWYNRYFGNYLSLNDILMGRGVRPVKVLFWQLLHPADILYLLDLAVLFVLDRISREEQEEFSMASLVSRYTLLGIALMVILLISQVYLSNERLGSQHPGVLYQRSTSAFVNVYGLIPLYSFEYTMLFHPQAYQASSPEELQAEPKLEREILPGVDLVTEDQNIIVIQVESLDANIIGHTYKGREITPFLNRLKEESLYFDNFYAQHVNGSFDAEFSFFTSIYSLNKNYGFKLQDLTAFDTIIEKLNRKGYETLAFHGNDKTFFFRDKAYEELGFDRFYSLEDFDLDGLTYPDATLNFGVNDYDFFLQSFDTISDTEEPFFAFLITVTSHTPFDLYPEQEKVATYDQIDNPLVREYFNSMTFTDAALEAFYTRLRDSALIDNSLIIIYADHNAGVVRENYTSDKQFILDKPVKLPENVPLFILHPDIEPGVSHKEGSPTDLAPTIFDLIGEQENPKDFVGNSLLQDIDTPILFMHEIPQVLNHGNLYIQTPDGLEFIGYAPGEGTVGATIPQQEEFLVMIDYLRALMLERRSYPELQ